MNRSALQERITSRISIEDRGYATPCWVSDRASSSTGYTKLGVNGKTWNTHRLAYIVFVADIPDGLVIDHLCRVRACCNPEHLEPVSHRTNLLRGDTATAREVATTHCPRGHAYDEANTYRRPDGQNKRDCRTCRNRTRRCG